MSRHPFDLLMELCREHIRLDCAALQLARDVYPQIDVSQYVRELDEFARQIAERRPGLSAPLRYQAMREVLVEEHELTGNQRDCYDPENSYLNRVLDRRVGNSVALAIVWIEVGRRLKWPVAGAALPGQFLVRFDDAERFVLADPFGGGRTLSVDDCRRLLHDRFDGEIQFSSTFLGPVSTCAMLSRILNTLRRIYLANRDWHRLAAVLRRLVAVEPRSGKHLQDLAAVHARLGDVRAAYGVLSAYLQRLPNTDDDDLVKGSLERLEAAIVALN